MFVPSINFYNPFINLIKQNETESSCRFTATPPASPFRALKCLSLRELFGNEISGSNSCLRHQPIATYLLWNFFPQMRQTFWGGESPLWTFLRWLTKLAFLVKLMGQPSTVHSKIRSLVCCRRWARSEKRLKDFLQNWHTIFCLLSKLLGSRWRISWKRYSAWELVLWDG